MPRLLLSIIFYSYVSTCLAAGIEVYFSPNGGCQEAVVSEIRKASQSIDIAMYYLSAREIAQALVKARERNVKIRIVLDEGQEIESASKAGYLVKRGFDIRYHLGFGLMHNKFALFDGQALITGSFNWTRTAEEKNEENLLVIRDPDVIKPYQNRFEYLWQNSRRDAREARGADAVPSWFCTSFHIFCTN